jgi:hypothetical protein
MKAAILIMILSSLGAVACSSPRYLVYRPDCSDAGSDFSMCPARAVHKFKE